MPRAYKCVYVCGLISLCVPFPTTSDGYNIENGQGPRESGRCGRRTAARSTRARGLTNGWMAGIWWLCVPGKAYERLNEIARKEGKSFTEPFRWVTYLYVCVCGVVLWVFSFVFRTLSQGVSRSSFGWVKDCSALCQSSVSICFSSRCRRFSANGTKK